MPKKEKLKRVEYKINSYTDESGQDTSGKVFVVATIIVPSDNCAAVEELLLKIEGISDKNKKWYDSGNKRRQAYLEHLLKEKIFKKTEVFYSIHTNKADYAVLTGSHISKAILSNAKDKSYVAKIFIDKMDKFTQNKIAKEIKFLHIRYKKIRRLSDNNSALIRMADAMCGLVRDMKNKNLANCYKEVFAKLQEV